MDEMEQVAELCVKLSDTVKGYSDRVIAEALTSALIYLAAQQEDPYRSICSVIKKLEIINLEEIVRLINAQKD